MGTHQYDIFMEICACIDISKVVRMDYGNERLCMELAIDSINIWNQWNEERTAEGLSPVYHNTGMLVFSGEDRLCENEKHSLHHIRAAGHDDWIEELSAEQIVSRYPYFETAVKNGISCAYYNKVGGTFRLFSVYRGRHMY